MRYLSTLPARLTRPLRRLTPALAALVLLAAPLPPAAAQDAAPPPAEAPAPAASAADQDMAASAAEISAEVEDDRGFITRFLERNLSGAGRQVVIRGFQGALSSRATFTEMTIADAEGVWITLRNGAIQWDRSALFGRRIEINELSAQEILLPRLPGGGEGGRKAEVRDFALPTLPVSVNIARIAAGRVEIGEPVIGEAAVVSLDGSMNLAGGEGAAKLAINRVDGKRGVFAVDAAYSNATTNLRLDVTLDEDREGLFANLVGLYDKPAVTAEIKGEGPLKEFAADIRLATDGTDRVTGRVSAHAQAGEDGTPGTGFRAELTGDVASLLPPDNRPFFGTSSRLLAEGWRGENGRMALPVLMVDTEALNLTGSVTTNDKGAPQSLVLLMTLGEDAGATTLPVRLPFGGEPTDVRSGSLQISYDATQSDAWRVVGRIGDITQNGNRIGALTLNGDGTVALENGDLQQVLGKLAFGVEGLALADAGLQQALGTSITGESGFDLTPGNALELSDFTLSGQDFGIAGTILADGLRSGITVSGDLDAAYERLEHLSTLAGRPLTGQANANIRGLYTVLTHGFDAEAEITGTDITVNQPQLDRLMAGEASIFASARRDEQGIEIRDLRVDGQRLTAAAQGLITSSSTDLKADLRLSSLTAADPAMAGALTAQAAVTGAPGARRVTVSGEATDLELGINELDAALKGRTNLTAIAQEKDGRFEVETLRLANPQLTADGRGSFAQGALDAALDLDVPDLGALQPGFAGSLKATATAREANGVRSIEATGTGQDLRLGQQDVDGALSGTTQFRLSAEQAGQTVTVRDLQLTNDQMTANVEGVLADTGTDLTATADIRSLAAFGRGWRGALRLDGSLKDDGTGARVLAVDGTGTDLALGQKSVDGVLAGETRLTVRGTERDGVLTLTQAVIDNPRAQADVKGTVGGGQTDLSGRVNLADLSALGLGWRGSFAATGRVNEEPGGLRRLVLDGTGHDLSLGQAQADGVLGGETRVTLRGTEQNGVLTIEQAVIDNPRTNADISGTIGGGQTNVQGRVNLADLSALGLGWRGSFAATGSFADDGSGVRRLVVDGTGNNLSLGQAQADAALAGPTRLTVRGAERDGVLTLEEAVVASARLNATARGTIGAGRTDVSADVRAASLAFLGGGIDGALNATARLVDQGRGRRVTAEGTASGLRIGNERVDPLLGGQTTFDLAATQSPGGALSIERLNARNGQLRLSADGSPQAGLNVDAALSDLALVVPGLPGPATVAGTVRQTAGRYDINLNATAPGGTRATIAGSAAQDFSTADIRASGVSDAALVNPLLRVRSIEGPVDFDLRLAGRPALENLSGRVSLPNARLSDPKLGLRVDNLSGTADLNGGLIQVNATGNVSAGGRVTVSGPVDLRGGTALDLTAQLDGVVLRDPNLYETRVDGTVRISGNPADGPLVTGTVNLGETEIRIPSTGLGGARAIPEIVHLRDRPPVRGTRAKAGLLPFPSADSRIAGMTAPPATPPANPARLDLTINAPNQVFVRGRGIDAELGGSLRLTGTARNMIPVGQLELIRGRIDLLGKRFDMTEGLIELQGSMIPVLRLVAETQQDEILTRIVVDGDIREPEITFESVPELPEEEVLSHLLFGRGLDTISPLQAAQLANAVAVLAGRGSEGIVSNLRDSVGLDDLDLATDDEGNVTVRAGKYLTRNVYTDVAVDADGRSRINLNLDVNDAVTARGSVASDGESTIGVFYERDY
ncbi:translocation/assembly module TamB domain-containing protein [Paracoccus panacisoli]|uniref:Translocation/assembly module TamB domain-containing protein n=1 Tax=Paracoccus panacisoli TaxID=1510163 RepID=A0ABV6T4P2_9RHOB